MKQWARGFTLIELMIVVVVVAILMAIAIPSYSKYLLRSHRSAGEAYLMDLAQREQEYLLDNRDYADTGTIKPLVAIPDGVAADYTVTVSELDVTTRPKPNFKLQAVPISGSFPARYSDGNLTIDERGIKSPPDKW